jgi:tRNA G18 (ribose-2'-O)-methylase SpoU
MRAFVDFFNQGWVGITIGLAVAVYIYWRSQRGARIAYHCKTIRVLGAKGHTLPEAVKMKIAMASGVDSLNVATAAAIALHRLRSAAHPLGEKGVEGFI